MGPQVATGQERGQREAADLGGRQESRPPDRHAVLERHRRDDKRRGRK